MLLHVLVRTYRTVRKRKERLIIVLIIERFLYYRTGWYGRVFLLDRFLT